MLRAEIVYRPDMLKIFLESLEANTRQKTLNPIELAHAYMKVVEIAKGMGLSNPHEAAAKYLGTSPGRLSLYIGLLKFPKDVQRLIANGTIQVSDAFTLKILMERNPDRPIEELIDLDARKERREGERRGKRGGKEPILDPLGAVGVVKRCVGAVGAFTTAAHDISGLTREALVDLMRERSKQPPEEVIRYLMAGAESIAWLLDITKEAALPPPLPEIEGKPLFTAYVDSILDQIEYEKHKGVLQLLAEASDVGVVYTVAEMSERLRLEPWDISTNTGDSYSACCT